MIIGLDLDGVCYEWDKTARYMLRRRYRENGRESPPELSVESKEWAWIEKHVTQSDWRWLWNEGAAHGLFRYGHVVRGAIEGVAALAQLGDVHIITARPKAAFRDTLDWLSFMFDKVPVAGLTFTEKKLNVQADIYIDDGPQNIAPLAESGRPVIALLRDWNRDFLARYDHRNLYIARDWPGIVDHARRLTFEILGAEATEA